MSRLTRRSLLKKAITEAAAASLAAPAVLSAGIATDTAGRKGRIKQSVSRWCFEGIPLEELCKKGGAMGLRGVDLLNEDEWEVPRRYGLLCSMGYAGGGEIRSAMNRVENHAKIEGEFRKSIPRAARLGVPNVITFSGNREGMSDDEGARNTIAGLDRVKIGRAHV